MPNHNGHDTDRITLAEGEVRSQYTIERTTHGLVFRGPIPLADFEHWYTLARNAGWEILDSYIAVALGATIVVTSKEEGRIWRLELGLDPDTDPTTREAA